MALVTTPHYLLCGCNLQWVPDSLEKSSHSSKHSVLETKEGEKSETQNGTSSCIKTLPPTNMETAYFLKIISLLSYSHSLRDLSNKRPLKRNQKKELRGKHLRCKNKADLISWYRKHWLWKQAILLFKTLPLLLASSLLDFPETLFSHLRKWAWVCLPRRGWGLKDIISSKGPSVVLVTWKGLSDGGC